MYKKNKAFSLIELMIILVALSLILMAFVPILFKRAEKVLDTNCVGGYKSVRLEFSKNGDFSVPIEITSPITVTLIGAGGGGTNGSIAESGQVTGSNSCTLSSPSNSSQFYTNVYFNAVQAGASADCSSSIAGTSGSYINNLLIRTEKGTSYSYSTSGNSFSWSNGIQGLSGDSGNPKFLAGGIAPVNVNGGEGQNCRWDDSASPKAYVADGEAGNAACKITYKKAQAGLGGSSGAYAKAKTNMVVSGLQCRVTVGSGGNANEVTTVNQNTSILCGQNIKYTALGAGQIGGADNFGFQLITPSASQNGAMIDASSILGGRGGNVTTDGATIYSYGGVGGCDGAKSSFECAKPNGISGTKGSGGGGGSCNEKSCGVGGKGGDGFVIVEYQMKCK